eukprot:TRINITY_DN15180_c0_g1_i1.p1 TRINITY_DN15180_c0_g1~~TRINITY_DN15180_c0_g1_i1.p1  ORF type:complete len:162 (+),score=9.53 TRINITY_DN15180_c0_g1_i1:78-563(+)
MAQPDEDHSRPFQTKNSYLFTRIYDPNGTYYLNEDEQKIVQACFMRTVFNVSFGGIAGGAVSYFFTHLTNPLWHSIDLWKGRTKLAQGAFIAACALGGAFSGFVIGFNRVYLELANMQTPLGDTARRNLYVRHGAYDRVFIPAPDPTKDEVADANSTASKQ